MKNIEVVLPALPFPSGEQHLMGTPRDKREFLALVYAWVVARAWASGEGRPTSDEKAWDEAAAAYTRGLQMCQSQHQREMLEHHAQMSLLQVPALAQAWRRLPNEFSATTGEGA